MARRPPNPNWPGGAAIAVNFNLNVEGGGESTLFNGDDVSEGMLNDIGVPAQRGVRSPLVESVFEYGSRRGAWRVLDAFDEFAVKMSILGVARALEQNPELAKACVERGHEIVSHGYRWIDYGAVAGRSRTRAYQARRRDSDQAHRHAADRLDDRTARPEHAAAPGRGRRLSLRPRFARRRTALLADASPNRPHLVIPYSYEANDNRFNENSGFSTADDFFTYMRDAFDVLYREGRRGSPKLLSIGLHDRLIGRPGRCKGLIELLKYMRGFDGVWFCTGAEIAAALAQAFSGTKSVKADQRLPTSP